MSRRAVDASVLVDPFPAGEQHVFFVAARTFPPERRAVVRRLGRFKHHPRMQQMLPTFETPPAFLSTMGNRACLAIRSANVPDDLAVCDNLRARHQTSFLCSGTAGTSPFTTRLIGDIGIPYFLNNDSPAALVTKPRLTADSMFVRCPHVHRLAVVGQGGLCRQSGSAIKFAIEDTRTPFLFDTLYSEPIKKKKDSDVARHIKGRGAKVSGAAHFPVRFQVKPGSRSCAIKPGRLAGLTAGCAVYSPLGRSTNLRRPLLGRRFSRRTVDD